jgi:hypothetical protein
VIDDGVPTSLLVSADREVRSENAMELESTTTITCVGCGAEPDGDLWDEICELSLG